MQPATQAWWFAAGRLLATVLLGLGAGWVFGSPWAGLAVALSVHLAWQLANLFRLEWWLRHRSYADPPEIGGVWGEVIAQIVRLHRRKRFHKQRFVQLFRQLQRSTAALPDGVVILNAQREIVWFNRMAARCSTCAAPRPGLAHREPPARAGVRPLPGWRPTTPTRSSSARRAARTATCRCRSSLTAMASSCCW